MRTRFLIASLCFLLALATGCSLFNSSVVWQGGPYVLLSVGKSDELQLSYNAGNGVWLKRVDPTVFAVGYDGEYLVAMQHPSENRSITNYFIVEATKDSLAVEVRDVVIGPLTNSEFEEKAAQLKLPAFSKVIESLK